MGTDTNDLRALAHDLRGAIGALGHQTQLLAGGELAPELHQRSIQAMEANIDELRRLLVELERLVAERDGSDQR